MKASSRPVYIGIVAGEVSGDFLGAGLIYAIKKRFPNASFEGICGPKMEEQGCKSLYPMENLSVIGLFEVFGKIRQLLKIRKDLANHFINNPPDVFIGIDVPDFNLDLLKKLKQSGIKTVQYVSPQVWAWRGYRIKKIRMAVDSMLVLFPFEKDYYERHQVPVTFVGHPLADAIEEKPDELQYRQQLGLESNKTIIALLPGSRSSELRKHAELFVKTAQWLYAANNDYIFSIPFTNAKTKDIFNQALTHLQADNLPIVQFDGQSRAVMAAADIILLASGTATLEAAILKKPMVVTYKVSPFSFIIFRLFSNVKLYAMPNNLAGRQLVPEYIQHRATAENLGNAVVDLLADEGRRSKIIDEFIQIHRQLKQDANDKAAEAICALIQ